MSSPIPDSLIRSIVAAYAPKRIVLFGSAARGMADPGSDLDLLVVLDDDAPPDATHWRRAHAARGSFTGPLDILPCREHVLRERARAVGSFADSIQRDGVVLYDRTAH